MVIVIPPDSEKKVPRELFICPWTLLVDTREQAPWSFTGLTMGGQLVVLKRERGTLRTADYSITGMEDRVCVERKSPEDLVGSVCGGHKRLEAEHERMAEIVRGGGFAALICEGNYAEIDDRLRMDGRDRVAETLLGCYSSWPFRFSVPWLFAGDRRRAELLAFRILYKWWAENNGKEGGK